MGFFKTMVALLRGGTSEFAEMERAILHAIEKKLDESKAQKLRMRLADINLVQRLDGGREVNSYCMRNGKPFFDEKQRIVDFPGELKLATYSFMDNEGNMYKGAAWIVNGYFFSMDFDNPTEHALENCPINLSVKIMI